MSKETDRIDRLIEKQYVHSHIRKDNAMNEGYCEQCHEEEWLYECSQCMRNLCRVCYGDASLLVCRSCVEAAYGKR